MKIYKLGDYIVIDAEGEIMYKPLQLEKDLKVIIKNFNIDASNQGKDKAVSHYPMAD